MLSFESRCKAGSDVHTFPPVVFSHAFVGLLLGQVALTRPPPMKGGEGLMSPVLIQNLPIVDEAPLQLLAVQLPVYHLKVGRTLRGVSTPFGDASWLHFSVSIRPGFGRTKRLCVRVTSAGVGAVASHFNRFYIVMWHVTLSGLRRSTVSSSLTVSKHSALSCSARSCEPNSTHRPSPRGCGDSRQQTTEQTISPNKHTDTPLIDWHIPVDGYKATELKWAVTSLIMLYKSVFLNWG